MDMQALPLSESTCLLVLTGAGISAESGVPTFRDAGGLWEGHDVQDVASPMGWKKDPKKVWRFYSQRRKGLASVRPNRAHQSLAEVEQNLGDRFLLVTQNVDALHTSAGSKRVIELHGNLLRTRCTDCSRPAFHDERGYEDVPVCQECKQGRLRPDIVWFGEAIDRLAMQRIFAFIKQAALRRTPAGYADLVFLAIGTSGAVYPAAGMVEVVRSAGGRAYLANLEESDNSHQFDEVVLGKATEIVPALLASAR